MCDSTNRPKNQGSVSVQQLIDAITVVDKYLRQGFPIHLSDCDNLAISDHLSTYDLHRIYSTLEIWLSVNNSFAKWARTYSHVHEGIIQVLAFRMVFFQRAILNAQALVIARFLKSPNVNQNTLTITTNDGVVKTLPEAYRIYIKEQSATQTNQWRYGECHFLRAINADKSPNTILTAMELYHRRLAVTPFSTFIKKYPNVSNQMMERQLPIRTTYLLNHTLKRPHHQCHQGVCCRDNTECSTQGAKPTSCVEEIPIKKQVIDESIKNNVAYDPKVVKGDATSHQQWVEAQDTHHTARILLSLRMLRNVPRPQTESQLKE